MRGSKYIKSLLLSGVLISLTLTAFAQRFPFEFWHEGRIVLEQGDTLKGMVKYDLQQDIIQHTRNDKTVDAFSARKVLFFEIFDQSVHKYRQFYTLPFTTAGTYRAATFFELLEEGKMTLLARENLEYKTYYTGYYGGSFRRLELVYHYFFLDESGNITEFTGNKNDLMQKMERRADDVEKYIRQNRLHLDEKEDFAKIVAYYNSFYGS
jgi:hypothetical protein